jgi:hypothetical protein
MHIYYIIPAACLLGLHRTPSALYCTVEFRYSTVPVRYGTLLHY